MNSNIRHFSELKDFSPSLLRRIIDDAVIEKARRLREGRFDPSRPLAGKVVALIFALPSTRTRISFDVGVRELGGEVLVLSGQDMQLGRGETIEDTARVLSRYVDLIVIRTPDPEMLQGLTEASEIPVINALTRASHPCQIMADIMTLEESFGTVKGSTLAWVGDCNNVFRSLAEAAARFDFTLQIAAPEPLQPTPELIDAARALGARLDISDNPEKAVRDAKAVITDCWVSMGDVNAVSRHNMLAPYQVNRQLMKKAAPDAIFLHCLPAHRGEEVTNEVIDGASSRVFDEAENRLHVQKSIMKYCLLGEGSLKTS